METRGNEKGSSLRVPTRTARR